MCNKNTFRDNSEKKEQLEEGKMKERTRQKKTQFNNKSVEKLVPPSFETISTRDSPATTGKTPRKEKKPRAPTPPRFCLALLFFAASRGENRVF